MPANFRSLRDNIRMWSNRDAEALPDEIIEQTMMWAADKAYRTLRVPPLEQTITYNDSESGLTPIFTNEQQDTRFGSLTRLRIPGDLIEFIHIRSIDQNGRTVRVFNEKADIRTYRDLYADKYSDLAYWARQGGDALLSPAIGNSGQGFGSVGVSTENRVELYYYRRLPALDATYDVTLANYRLGLLEDASGNILPANSEYTQAQFDALPNTTVGREVSNWLKDENERIIIFGSLAESFAYLQENEESQKYMAMFYREIQELNDEDRMRNASGGNVQVNFNGRGLI